MLIFLLFFILCSSVKHSDFKTCEQSGFCTRQKAYKEFIDGKISPYNVEPSSLIFKEGQVQGQILNGEILLNFTLYFLDDGMIRFQLEEKLPVKRRFRVPDVLMEKPNVTLKKLSYKHEKISNGIKFYFGSDFSAVLKFSPFQIEARVGNELVALFNKKSWFNFEHQRIKEAEIIPDNNTNETLKENLDEKVEGALNETISQPENKMLKDLWEESFNGFLDSKPLGPNSFGFDISFPGSSNIYGLPEHASHFNLKNTDGKEGSYKQPYRLYNLDVFEFELDSPMALYGSIPFVVSHKINKKSKTSFSTGFFLLNSAETWVDVIRENSQSSNLLFQKEEIDVNTETTITHWMTESGIMDFFILLGPTPYAIQRQYAILTGSQNLPNIFSLGYHQCRWNYNDIEDVEKVHEKFEELDIPFDVLWLDIEHTDDKKYFTWHEKKFSDPVKMQNDFSKFGRKMVTIIDPHIKRDDQYHVKSQGSSLGLFVKNKKGEEFDGWCWPGSSSWIDFLNPLARQFWSKLFDFETYKGSTEHLFTWNDMNEPSVFTGPEITMPKDNLHLDGIEHRDIHNIYGMLLHRSTYSGHIYRSLPGKQVSDSASWLNRADLLKGPKPHRPFVLSRAFFAGTQRYGAIWTGDNMAKWEHLASTIPMLLSISMAGIGFCGADVGGFFFDPSSELLTRWYQAGAFYPFFRGHAHIDTKRREPWLLGEPYTSIIRDAIIVRYKLIPLWYTLFRRGQIDGTTPIRPLFFEFPLEEKVFGMGSQYLVGSSLMITPIVKSLEEGGNQTPVYLPGNDIWYNFYTHLGYRSQIIHNFKTELKDPVPTLIKAGTIFPTRERLRRSTQLMKLDPLTLTIALNREYKASGEYYLDDGESFSYSIRGEFIHKNIKASFEKNQLLIESFDEAYALNRKENSGSNLRMKNWQKPFLSDPIHLDSGNILNFEDIERSMNFKTDSEFQKNFGSKIKIEKILVLAPVSFPSKISKIILSSDSVQSKDLDLDLIETQTISSSNMYGNENSQIDGVVEVRKIIIKKPPLTANLNWKLKILFE